MVFVHKNYVTPLPPLENQFSPRLGLIPLLDSLIQANRDRSLTFDQISQEIGLISSNLLKNYVILLSKTMFSLFLDPFSYYEA